MSDALVHRGPDGADHFQTNHAALAVRRLSIIDPLTGWQPLYNEDRSLVLIANGEIYNYVELRDQLRQCGHAFRTGSDCEVILHLYEDHGEQCVHHLRGMFAFALWDSRNQRLVLARDRIGEKPLYVYEQDGQLAFASELKALLRSGMVDFKLAPQAIDLFFHYQYSPDPWTPIEGVRKLPTAHILTISVNPWSTREACYWRMEDAPPLDDDPVTRIRTELESVSKLVVRSDVPIGLALSGGLDSSAVAVLTAKAYPGVIHAFSVGYPGRPHFDERADAKALADYLRMPFHDVEISTPDMVDIFPDLVYWRDDPIADISGYGYYAIARAAKNQGVPVILQGQGGDELFWGYPWVTDALQQSIRKSLLDEARGPTIGEYVRLSWPKARGRRAWVNWLRSLAGLRSSWAALQRDRFSPRDRLVFYDLTADFHAATRYIRDIYQPQFNESLGDSMCFDIFTAPLPWSQIEILMTRLICQTYLSENGITQGDRLSMASSVELRLPFVDFRLVETVIGLRKAQSDVRLRPKAWLREATRDVVPDWVRKRPKRGFQPPVRAWHRALFANYGHLLDDGVLVQLGILKPEAARQFVGGPFPFSETVPLSFKALVLEVWCRKALSADVVRKASHRPHRAAAKRTSRRRQPTSSRHVLVFEPDLGGHRGDYLRHLLEGWTTGPRPGRLTIAVAPRFAAYHPDVAHTYARGAADGVRFVTIDAEALARVQRQYATSLLRYGVAKWRLAVSCASRLGAEHCLLTYFDHYQLPLALHLPAPCTVSGIYFRPTFHYDRLSGHRQTTGDRLRVWRQLTLVRRALNHRAFSHLFCLDELAVDYLRPYSSKAVYLPDPVRIVACPTERVEALRREIAVSPERKVLLLFGDFRQQESLERKGVAQTLTAMRALRDHEARQCCLLLAGQMSAETIAWLKEEFATMQRSQPIECRLLNRYIAEEDAQALFHLSSLVMIPYQRHVGMSGVLVRAAAAGVPVLASDYGLVGALVKQHRLGWVLDSSQSTVFAQALLAFFRQTLPATFDTASARGFAECHAGSKFSNLLLDRILHNG